MPFSVQAKTETSHTLLAAQGEGYEPVDFGSNALNFFAAQLEDCEPHWHDAAELIYILEGNFQISVNNRSFELEKGGMVYINGGDIHSIHAGQVSSRLLTLQISPTCFDMFACSKTMHLSVLGPPSTEKEKAVCSALLWLIHDELEQPERSSFRTLGRLFKLLASVEAAENGPCYSLQKTLPESDIGVIRKAIDFINKNFHDELTLQNLADRFGISYHRMSRMFKKVSRRNFNEYLIFLRVHRAKQLLLDTNIPITEISQRAGFSDHKQLIHALQKHCGVTPTEFRKTRRAPSAGQETPMLAIRLDTSMLHDYMRFSGV